MPSACSRAWPWPSTPASIKADYIAHGSTGAGNDQVRFDVAFSVIAPNTEIITPIRDLKLSRQAEIDFLNQHGFEMSWEKAKYSINKGIWGTSVGGVETLTSDKALPESAYPTQLSATEPTRWKSPSSRASRWR